MTILLCTLIQAAALTEEQAVALALEKSPQLAVLRAGVRTAALAPRGMALLPNPQLRLGVTDIAAEINDPATKRNNVGLAWQPPRLGALRAENAMVEAREHEAASALATARARAAAEVRLIHRTLVVRDEQIRVAEESIRLRRQILTAVDEQLAAGVKTLLARHPAELALAEARAAAEELRQERLLQAVRLARHTGLEAAALEVEAGSFAFTPGLFDREQLRRRALEIRPELDAVQARCRAAEAELGAARRERYPWFSSVQFFRRTGRLELPGSWGIQVGVEIPVFRWKEGRVPAAEAALDQCRTQQRATGTAIGGEIDELVTRLEAAAAVLMAERPPLTKQAGEARAMLAAGRVDKVEPLLAELRVLDARQAWLSRWLEYQALEAGLRQALAE